MTFQTPLALQAVSGDSPVTYSAAAFRAFADNVFVTQGKLGVGDPISLSQRGAGANMSVDIGPGAYAISLIAASGLGKVVGVNDAIVNLPITAANPAAGNTRRDAIVVLIYDKQSDANTNSGSAAYAAVPYCVTGTPSTGTPAAPSLPSALATQIGGTVAGYLQIGTILRTSSDVSISNAAITETYAPAVVGSVIATYSTTPTVASATSGTLGAASTAVPALPYDACHIIDYGCFVNQSVATDVNDVVLRISGTGVRACRAAGPATGTGGYVNEYVQAGTAVTYQIVTTRISGSGTYTTLTNPLYTWLDVTVTPVINLT